MRLPRSLQARLGLFLGLGLTLLWIATATVTAVNLRHEMDEVFDSALQETAQRLLPLAVQEIVGRDDDGVTQRLGAVREHSEFFTYIVRDAQGRILLQSHSADPKVFPAYDGAGFRQTPTHRIFNEDALQGSVRISVAEPLEHRAEVARSIEMGLGLPLLAVIPLALLAIALTVRASFASVRRFRDVLGARDARDLSPVPADDIPLEMTPVAATLNDLLTRLKGSFDAERSFAANAAHELRTPLAGAIAQAQRLQSETQDKAASARAADIETTLKRLTRFSERLMQLARAEGGRLRLDQTSDLRTIAKIIVDEAARASPKGRIDLTLAQNPVLSDLDPDALGILLRNLIENAIRHGAETAPIDISLSQNGTLSVANAGPVVPPQKLKTLTSRFERAGLNTTGSGLGLAIVAAIAERIGSELVIASPRRGKKDGFEVRIKLPISARA